MLPIYYTNVARRTDRREFMDQQFAALGLEATRIGAITPERIQRELLERYCDPRLRRRLAPGDLACGLTHQLAWKDLLAGSAPAAVIFEDDGLLSERLPEFLGHLDAGLPAGVDVIKFETMGRQAIRLSNSGVLELGAFTLRRLLGTHYGACGYVISRRMVEHALVDPDLNRLVIDTYLFSRFGPAIYRRRIYQAVPALCIQLSQDPAQRDSSLATSDLAGARKIVIDSQGVSRWQRLLDNVWLGLRDARYFGSELPGLLGPRHSIPFADD